MPHSPSLIVPAVELHSLNINRQKLNLNQKNLHGGSENSGGDRNRTCDLLRATQTLKSRLSYAPKVDRVEIESTTRTLQVFFAPLGHADPLCLPIYSK